MKNYFEILNQYVKTKEDKVIYKQLSIYERVLLNIYYRDTIGFNIYLLKYRIKEFYCQIFVKFIKNFTL